MNDFSFYDDVVALERFLNLPKGALSNIPIYARKPAVDAIIKVKEMEKASLFRPGLYYIVLVDLCANTAFNAKYGDKEGDIRIQWFHTAVIESIGETPLRNYVAFSKTIGDASLIIFSSFLDVVDWSDRLSSNLSALSDEYMQRAHEKYDHLDEPELEALVSAFSLKARRLVHLGEVSYKEDIDPLSLAVSQTFKIEKYFAHTDLGCTQSVAQVIKPKLLEAKLILVENFEVEIPGLSGKVMTYYLKHIGSATL